MTTNWSALIQQASQNLSQKQQQQHHVQQFSSARQIRPSLFLNEVDFHLPIIPQTQQRQITEDYTERIVGPKSHAVSPQYRRTQPDQQETGKIELPRHFIRSLRKQRLYIRNSEFDLKTLHTFVDEERQRPEFLTPEQKRTPITRLHSHAQTFRSPIFNAGEQIATDPKIVFNQKINSSTANPKSVSDPTLTADDHLPTLKPMHKKTVSFRNSITIVDVKNGTISKDTLNQGEKPLVHIHKHVQSTQEDSTNEFLKQLHPDLVKQLSQGQFRKRG